MKNKSNVSTGSGSRNVSSPSPPPSSLCFRKSQRNNGNTSTNNDKKQHHHHYHDPYPNIGLCGCHQTSKSRCVSAFGVLILVIIYAAMGSILFVTLEGDDDIMGKTVETAVAASKPRTDLVNADMRSRTVDRLWSITEDLNILYKENWTRLAAQEVQLFQDTLLRSIRATKIQQSGGIQAPLKPHKWSYASAFLYSITLITTIGYGSITPRTQWGRIAALLYALFGIPIVLLYLSAMGDALSTSMRCIFRKLRTCGSNGNRSDSSNSGTNSGTNSNSSSTTGIGTINGRPDSGSVIDKSYHNQSIISSSNLNSSKLMKSNPNYDPNGFQSNQQQQQQQQQQQFYNNYNQYYQYTNSVPISICIMILICYITLGAALFHQLQNWNALESIYFCFTSLGTIGFGDLEPKGYIAQYAASVYIIVGMAIGAMCFNLIQSEILRWMQRFDANRNQQTDEKSIAATISGPGNGSNVNAGLSQAGFAHLMSHGPPSHHNHMFNQLPSVGQQMEDVALVTVAVAPKS